MSRRGDGVALGPLGLLLMVVLVRHLVRGVWWLGCFMVQLYVWCAARLLGGCRSGLARAKEAIGRG